MVRTATACLVAGLIICSAPMVVDVLLAQDFPYSVPQAPEFDEGGNLVQPGGDAPTTGRRATRSWTPRPEHESATDYRAARPIVSQEPPVPARPRPQRVRSYTQSQDRSSAMASAPAQQAPGFQERPDCSRYPMMIARAGSEQEMQMTVKMYLKCLLDSGWNMEQARTHVIRTIESTYRLPR
jgi:hypothetical protein